MASKIASLRCDKCFGTVEALWIGRWGGYVCWLCWAKQESDTPESRLEAATAGDWESDR
jgi:hypothetical protein